jgi:MFS family permease
MIARFCLYSVLKNLRFADPFLLLFLLHRGYTLTAIGAFLGAQHLFTGTLELPLGVAADRFGRRRSLALCFVCYAAAFELFPLATPGRPLALGAALLLFGLGEALRTGSHKAIMLDYLERRGERQRATEVVGLTRGYSRLSSGSAALGGGALLYVLRDYAPLFHLSAAAAVSGFFLMLTYPRELEGEQRRASRSGEARVPLRERLRKLGAYPRVAGLLVQSVLFESQVKLVRKYYLQPFLKQGLALTGLPVLGAGALAIGGVELLADVLGAVGARSSARLQRLLGGRRRALRVAYVGAMIGTLAIAASAALGSLWPGVLAAITLWLLQNARRPVFVAAFGDYMDKPQRATSLSVESLARTVTLSLLLPLCGLLADRVGLWAAFALVATLLLLGAGVPQPAQPAEQDGG